MQRTINYVAPAEPSRENSPPPGFQQTPQSRKLNLRNARFRASRLPMRNVTPLGPDPSSISPQALDGSDELFSAAIAEPASGDFLAQQHDRAAPSSSPTEVLAEISNGSMRMRRRRQYGDNKAGSESLASYRPATAHHVHSASAASAPIESSGDSSPELDEHAGAPARAASPRKRRKSTVNKRTSNSRRSVSGGETSKYIDHLEAQWAIASAQLQTLTSPTAVRSQGAKLRMMHAEAETLRQQLAEWETTFAERVQEQVQEHILRADALRDQLEQSQQEREADRQKLRDFEMQCEQKDQALLVTEAAKYDLERRLEFLSELLASSPAKIDLHAETDGEARRRPARPRSFEPGRRLSLLLMSPERRAYRPSDSEAIPSLSRPSSQGSHAINPFFALAEQSDSGYSTEQVSDRWSQQVYSDDEMSPTKRLSWIRAFPPIEPSESRRPPARRMRKFHSGSTGPRSLILPAATHAGSWPASAPVDAPSPSFTAEYEAMSSSPFLMPPEAEGACLWFPSRSRSQSTGVEPRMREHSREMTRRTPKRASLTPPEVQIDDYSSDSDADPSVLPSRVVSMSSMQGFNLFDELNRFREGSSDDGLSPHPHANAAGRNGEDADETLLAESTREQFPSLPSHTAKGSGSPCGATDGALSVIPKVSAFVVRSLDQYAVPARAILSSAWRSAALTRPMVEFRWWLIRLLLKGLRRKARVLRRSAAKNTGAAVGLGLVASPGLLLLTQPRAAREGKEDDEDESLLEGLAYGEAIASDARPREIEPVTWTKFSMALFVAVGLAIRDGPASLLLADVEAVDVDVT